MKKIIISPFSKKLKDNKRNAKDYPYWDQVIEKLKQMEFHIIQVGINGEQLLDNVDEYFMGKSFDELKSKVMECDCWISVDNFFPHFCHFIKKYGIVLWGKSDPDIFGYPENINLLLDRKFLRKNQYLIWDYESYDEKVFVLPDVVIKNVINLLSIK
jgi:hypothetical protein